MTRRAAATHNITQIKDVTDADAKRVRAIWKAVKTDDLLALYPDKRAEMLDRIIEAKTSRRYRQLQRELINDVIGTCGVEHLGYDRRANRHIYYCNAGDTYATTICFVGDSLVVRCWGDYAERGTLATEQEAY